MTKLVGGLRPDIPADMPEALAELMQKCWQQRPEDRPRFVEIVADLEALPNPITTAVHPTD